VRATQRRVAWVVAAIGVALLAGACGGSDNAESVSNAVSDDGTESRAVLTTCDLLEGVDSGLLLGESAGEPHPDGTVCRVDPADAASRGQLGLVVETDRPDDNFETQREVFGVDTEVAGLGDAAFHSGGYLFVLDGETFFFLQVVRDASLNVGVPDGDLEAAAHTVIENLES
jgi:hypothetical protein